MDDTFDSSVDSGADAGDSEITSYSADDIAELAAAAQEVLDAPPEDLPAEEEVAEPVPAEPEPEPEPVPVPVAVAEPTPAPAAPVADATPVAAKGGCATLLVGLFVMGALLVMLLL